MDKEMMRSIARALSGRVKSVIAQVARQEASRFVRHLRERLKAGFAPPATPPRTLESPPPPTAARPVEPALAAPEATVPAPPPGAPSPAEGPQTAKAPPKRVAAKKATGGESVKTVDLNTASRAELVTLPGIGPSRADAILNGRPYKDAAELVGKRILPEALFTSLRERLRAD